MSDGSGPPAATTEAVFGARRLRPEDSRLLAGQGCFLDDIRLPGELVGQVVRSPHAHAGIRRIDTADAAAMPGVAAIVTAADLHRLGAGPLQCFIQRERRPGEPLIVPPRLALADDVAVHVGDPVAFVVAETAAAALAAAEAVEVDYQERPAIVGTAGARAPDAGAIWPAAPDNVCFEFEAGNRTAVEAAFASAAHVVVLETAISRVAAMPLEPRGAIARYDPASGRYTLWSGHQKPFLLRRELAGILGIAERDLHIVVPDVGGGFGMKGATYPEHVLTLVAARLCGRPVRWTATRSESFASDDHGRDTENRVELALDESGRFLGLRVRTFADLGGYLSNFGPHSSTNNLGGLSGVYRTGPVHVHVTGLFTNSAPTGPYRGAGRPEATYLLEREVDAAANQLGVDRVELRRRNLVAAEAMPFATGFLFTYDSGDFARGMELALELADWASFEQRRLAALKRGRLAGIGLANAIEQAGAHFPETAEIEFHPDGGVTLVSGTISNGQGHEGAFEQVLAHLLGPLPGPFRLVQGDTDRVGGGSGTFGSRSLSVGGAAVKLAAERIVDKCRAIAAHRLEAALGDVVHEAGRFVVAGTDRGLTLGQVVALAHDTAALPPALEPGLCEKAEFTPQAPTFPNGTHVCEVEIERETGCVEIVRYTVVDDVGNVVNPMLLEGQIHGGLAQGVGQILGESIVYDETSGQLITGTFLDYAMPRADQMGQPLLGDNVVPAKTNPLGIKGAGEAGTVGALACVANAILDGVARAGARRVEMPFTSARIWQALNTGRD